MKQCLIFSYSQNLIYPSVALYLRFQSSNSSNHNGVTLPNKTRRLKYHSPVNYSNNIHVGKKWKKYSRKYYKIKTPITNEISTKSSHDGIDFRKSHAVKYNTEEILNPFSFQSSSQSHSNDNIGNNLLQNCKLDRDTKYPGEKKSEENIKLLLRETHNATKCKKFLKELETRLR